MRLLLIIAAVLLMGTGCQAATPTPATQGLRIMATTTVLADFARNIAGNRASVASLLPAGADPHAYQATPADAVRVSHSNVLIENGADYEHTFQTMLDNADGQRTKIVASEGLSPEPASENTNPHFWVDPQFAIKYVENIRDGLVQADPANADAYTANAESYIGQLTQLDGWARQQVLSLPANRRVLVTNHDALGYFADHYGFKVIGILVPSSSDEAGAAAQHLAQLVDTIKSSGSPVIFVDAVENPSLAEQIAGETGTAVVSDLYFESLSAADGPAATYLEMMHHDVSRIVEALRP